MTLPIDTFAAHLAHLLNTPAAGQAEVIIQPYALYAALTTTLANNHYAHDLLYHPTYAWRMAATEAAERYFAATLERPLWLSVKVDRSAAHRLLAALCERGVIGNWSALRLERGPTPASTVTALLPTVFRDLAGRLEKLPFTLSSGNPANAIRQRQGALYLHLPPAYCVVPEELSLWDALCVVLMPLRPLAAGEPFNQFCGLLIDALRTANRPIQELLGLNRRLCPFDWLDVLSIHQVRGLRQFLQALPPDSADTPSAWRAVWDKHAVPGFADAGDLWRSDLGQALRECGAPPLQIDLEELADLDAEPVDVLTRQDFADELLWLVEHGVITAAERDLLRLLYDGVTLKEALSELKLTRQVRERGLTPETYADDLHRRIHSWRSC